MAKTQEATAEGLAQDLQRLRGLHAEKVERIGALEGEVRLAEARDAELARKEFAGEDHRKERVKVDELRTLRGRERARELADLALLAGELQRVEADLTVAERQAQVARHAAGGLELRAGTAALAAELREILSPLLPKLSALEALHEEVRHLEANLYKTEFLGGQALVRLRHSVDGVLHGIGLIEKGGTPR